MTDVPVMVMSIPKKFISGLFGVQNNSPDEHTGSLAPASALKTNFV
jgi:hypothetical protein